VVGIITNDEAGTVTTVDDKTVKMIDDGTLVGTAVYVTIMVFEPTIV
jgi:hypothetical protein